MTTRVLYMAIGVWFAVVVAIVVLGLAAGLPRTLGNGALVLFVGVLPPVIVLRLFGQPEPQTVAEMLRQ